MILRLFSLRSDQKGAVERGGTRHVDLQRIRPGSTVRAVRGRQAAEIRFVHLDCPTELLEVSDAANPNPVVPRLLEGRVENGRQEGDDHDDDQEFDEREALPFHLNFLRTGTR